MNNCLCNTRPEQQATRLRMHTHVCVVLVLAIKICHAPSFLYAYRMSICGYPSRCLCIVDAADDWMGRGIREIAGKSLARIQAINYAAGSCAIVSAVVVGISSVLTKAETITDCPHDVPYFVCVSSFSLSLVSGIATIVLASISIALSQVGFFGLLVHWGG